MNNFKETMYEAFKENNTISPAYFDKYSVKRGLRNPDGTGVMAGVTNICNVHGYVVDDGEKKPAEGKLIFRGYNIRDLIGNVEAEGRFGFEEIAYLLLTGKLPKANELEEFTVLLSDNRALPENFLIKSYVKLKFSSVKSLPDKSSAIFKAIDLVSLGNLLYESCK